MLSRLADRFVLRPSQNRIPADHKLRRTLDAAGQAVEVWIERTDGRAPPMILPSVNGRPQRVPFRDDHGVGQSPVPDERLPEPELFILKFNGSGGRAERTSMHPLDYWSDVPGEIWSPNPPGSWRSSARRARP